MAGVVASASNLAWCAAVLISLLGGCDSRPSVVLYVSADPYVARPIIAEFERRAGIRVDVVEDTEQRKTTALARRLAAERDRPVADVFWSSEVFRTVTLAADGVFEPHESDATRDWPERARDPERRWYGFAARARVVVYAPDRVAEADRPQTWMDLTNPRFKGRVVMADPRFGTTGGHLAAMYDYWDRVILPGYYQAFLEGLAENEVRLLPGGNAAVVEAVARGEADVGMTDTDDVWAAQARGLDVEMCYPGHRVAGERGSGTLLIPNTVARVANGPNPERAARLIDYLLSEEVARRLARSGSHNLPLRPALAAEFEQYAVPDPLRVDYARVAAALGEAIEKAMKTLRHDAT